MPTNEVRVDEHQKIKSKVDKDSVQVSSKGNIGARNMRKVHKSAQTVTGMKMST